MYLHALAGRRSPPPSYSVSAGQNNAEIIGVSSDRNRNVHCHLTAQCFSCPGAIPAGFYIGTLYGRGSGGGAVDVRA